MGTFYWRTFQSLFTFTWVKKFSQYFYFHQSIFKHSICTSTWVKEVCTFAYSTVQLNHHHSLLCFCVCEWMRRWFSADRFRCSPFPLAVLKLLHGVPEHVLQRTVERQRVLRVHVEGEDAGQQRCREEERPQVREMAKVHTSFTQVEVQILVFKNTLVKVEVLTKLLYSSQSKEGFEMYLSKKYP